jgi:hypothetical protein
MFLNLTELFIDAKLVAWWLYSALLLFAIFFRFSRVFSIRNVDLCLLLVLALSATATLKYRDEIWAPETPQSSDAEDPRKATSAESKTAEESLVADSQKVVTDSDPGTNLVATDTATAASPELAPATDAEIPRAAPAPTMHPGYTWGSTILLITSFLLIIRLVFDESLTRRPRLDQNLNAAGIMFLCIPAFALLITAIAQNPPQVSTRKAFDYGKALLERRDVQVNPNSPSDEHPAPTETLVAAGGAVVAQLADREREVDWVARSLVIVAHTLVVLGLIAVGKMHFANTQQGVAMALLYLLLPCTAVYAHQLSHVLPAACLIWAIASYRNPVVAGVLLGLASGTLFFAVFLLPVWAVFYGRRGSLKFAVSVMGVAAILVTTLLLISGDASSFSNKLVTTTNWSVYRLLDDTSTAYDDALSQLYIRIPMAAIFFVMLTAMTVLPRPRNLENLLSNSTSLVVAAQLWYPDDIGRYVLWYLPLLLLIVFRPRLDRLVPPDRLDRQSASLPAPTSVAGGSSVAMSRLSFFR